MRTRIGVSLVSAVGLLSGCPDPPVSFGASSDVGDSTGSDAEVDASLVVGVVMAFPDFDAEQGGDSRVAN